MSESTDHEEKEYPGDLNPFGSDEEGAKPNAKPSTNPFGSSDDEDEETIVPHSFPLKTSRNASPVPNPTPRKSLALGVPSDDNASIRRGSAGSPSRLKPPVPAPRRISMIDATANGPPRSSSGLSVQDTSAGTPRSASSLSLESQTSGASASAATTPKKRQAPPVPRKDNDMSRIAPANVAPTINGNTPTCGSMRKTKKPAPPPPVGAKKDVSPNLSNSDLERSLESSLNGMSITSARFQPPKSGDSSAGASPVFIKRPTLTKSSNDREIEHTDTGAVDSADENRVMELLEELNAEHRLIQAELRQLIEMPVDRRTDAHQAREEQLLKDLVENVKRREELEYEEDDEDPGQTLTNKPTKKMKKKRKFKIKKLLGVGTK
ncbi:translation initiation factor IF-2-like [Paramacrobiotus metropolitanus]|uniref:translation initiation factor IF-2-like n=1 Tax=Paramacrobiotus metropolitanus TaxID=2943436 RepID=UPI002445EAE7|nr:translation initiation factor IF-2-like [Paramacrobiotus metropolitanus]